MLNIDQIRAGLQDRNLKAVARATGLSHNTVWRLASGLDSDYSYKTLQKLSDYLEARTAEMRGG